MTDNSGYEFSGGINSVGEVTEYKKQTSYEPTYVTAPQGKILINGMLIDECYDIQYSYREFKEPVYGYNSRHFDKILPGTVIIHGAFTINYKHDGYLHSALHIASGGDSGNDLSSIDAAILRKEDLKQKQIAYRSSLDSLRASQESRKGLLDQKAQAEVAMKTATQHLSDAKSKQQMNCGKGGALDAEVSSARKKYQEYVNSLTTEQLEQVTAAKKEVKEAQTLSSESSAEYAKLSEELLSKKNQIRLEINKLIEQNINNKTVMQKSETKKTLLKDTNATEEEVSSVEAYITRLRISYEAREDKITSLKAKEELLDADIAEQEQSYRKIAIKEDDSIEKSVTSTPETVRYIELKQRLDVAITNKTDGSSLIKAEVMSFQDVFDKASANLKSAQKKLGELEQSTDALRESMIDNKKKVREINDLVIKHIELGDDYVRIKHQRAEDYKDFNIFIEYNGDIHKVLMHCQLTGHTHALPHSGDPVREQYTFIAKKINA